MVDWNWGSMMRWLLLMLLVFIVSCAFTARRVDVHSPTNTRKTQTTMKTNQTTAHNRQQPVLSLKSKRKRTYASVLLGYLAEGIIPESYQQKLQKRERPPHPHSVDEAVVAIALVEQAINDSVSLAELAARMHFDILQAFKTNPYLQHSRTLPRIAKALHKITDDAFAQHLVTIVTARVEKLRAGLERVEMLLALPADSQHQADTFGELSSDLFRAGDYLIMEADYLANHGEYRQALQRLESLDHSSPLHQIAHEKRTEISNKAVHDLRKKAAIAYQKAGTISDMNTRIAYLNEASIHLRRAINRYPNAETLATVKSNLATISATLQKLRSMASANPRNN